ncbi:GAF domain-containing sensor histidine kinase [Oscillatoria sp. CS-180]|uniref:sensor histidine kinase n=1 Tax=Oscillatoria sp. CS-180 TaxID=3021720 RepID=UPI00232CE047|nr:GAF domain-containing sensor histidine kinase [Oscillatoria sp. CS-180]MDB9524924.1 GAF domain-containing sensor histidine kinase [Oscillatoria sp. CS-180]
MPERAKPVSIKGKNLSQRCACPCPDNEIERLAALNEYDILDSLPEQYYDDLTQLAAYICETPIALISFLDRDRQWFKSRYGLTKTETPREYAFCAHSILKPNALFIVSDATQDERFYQNPLVTGAPNIRFYAGASLMSPKGLPLGTICVIDRVPRQLTPQQEESLWALGRQVMAQLELRVQSAQLQNEKATLQRTLERLTTTQHSLLQAEKMSVIGELIVDVAQRISDPLNFIHGNLQFCQDYTDRLLKLVSQYRDDYISSENTANPDVIEELDYLVADFPKLVLSMRNGSERARAILRSLQTLSYHTRSPGAFTNVNESLNTVCELLQGQFQENLAAKVVKIKKRYSDLPAIYCVPGQLNQALIHLLDYALMAVAEEDESHHSAEKLPEIVISTHCVDATHVQIAIANNRVGLSEEEQTHLTGPMTYGHKVSMGTAISYRIIQEMLGTIDCQCVPGQGTRITVTLPICAPTS